MTMSDSSTEKNPRELTQSSREKEMLKYGIVRQPSDYFIYRDYRYSNLEDAIAQGKRDEAREKPEQR